jgi:hypothetical protein
VPTKPPILVHANAPKRKRVRKAPAQKRTESRTASIGRETERSVREFVSNIVPRLSDMILKEPEPEFVDDIRFECGPDGHFRLRKRRVRPLALIHSDEWLLSQPGYQKCVARLRSDVIVGPHLDRMVGTPFARMYLGAPSFFKALINTMLDDDGRPEFTTEKFESAWREWAVFFCTDQIAFTTVAPLPMLTIPEFPLRLNDELVLDRLTNDEVTRCHFANVLRGPPIGYQFIDANTAVGIRKTTLVSKVIEGDTASKTPSHALNEGSFGRRPFLYDHLAVDDVLSALRLLKQSQLRTTGYATWTDTPFLKGGTSFGVFGQWPYVGRLELSEGEVTQLLELWCLLEERAERFGFSIHRFNLAFDRGLIADKIVDLVIAAEALFLADQRDRSELRFRFALRAAKFIKQSGCTELEVFRIMRKAYDARSAIVHGGASPTALPSFIDNVEHLVRLGLREALAMKKDGNKLRQSDYWNSLLLSETEP